MKKFNIAVAIVVITSILGIVLYYKTKYHFFGGIITGSSITLVLFASVGKWQANQVAKHIEKRMRDQAIL